MQRIRRAALLAASLVVVLITAGWSAAPSHLMEPRLRPEPDPRVAPSTNASTSLEPPIYGKWSRMIDQVHVSELTLSSDGTGTLGTRRLHPDSQIVDSFPTFQFRYSTRGNEVDYTLRGQPAARAFIVTNFGRSVMVIQSGGGLVGIVSVGTWNRVR